MSGVQYNISVASPNSNAVFDSIENGLKGITDSLMMLNKNFIGFSQQSIGALNNLQTPIAKTTQGFSEATNKLLAFNQTVEGIRNLSMALTDAIQPGVKLDTQLHDLSAITGQVGDDLRRIEMAARASAKEFGTNAAQNVESYKLILSQLSPEIANNAEAMKMMGNNVNILSKTMGGNTVAATEVLTTAMNQYKVSLDDPILASKVMAEMMNTMAAAAKEGSAELPQIKAALEASGMMAKTTGVAFSELNASIQVLDKAGKKGAEGGVAIRNMLAELSQGAMNSPKTIAMLQAAGISVDKLADRSLSFSERLKLLAPIANNTAAMTQLFGKENVAAAIALSQNTKEIDRLNGAITGTNTAVEQAKIVMSGYEERQARIKAKIDEWKISLFQATEAMTPYITNTVGALVTTGQLASGIVSVTTAMKIFKVAKIEDAAASTGAGVANGFFATMMRGVTGSVATATGAVKMFSMALKSIPVIGWIITAIAAVIAIFKLLWDHSKRFREILFGIWEAGKAVFHNIGIVIGRVANIVRIVFGGVWQTIKAVFEAIWNGAIAAFSFVWNIISTVGSAIADFFVGIWNFISGLFSSVVGFLDEWIVTPIKNAFSGVWDFITGIFNKIWDGLKSLFQPIIDLWEYIFGGEGMEDVSKAYEKGEKKGAASYDKDHAKEETTATTTATPGSSAAERKQIADMMKGMGGTAGNLALGKSGKGGSQLGSNVNGGGAKSISIKIEKIVGIEKFMGSASAAAKQTANNILEEITMAVASVNGKLSTS